jgi:hypothetical protein
VSVGCNFDKVGCDGVVNELVVFRYKLVQALLDDLQDKQMRFSQDGSTYVVTIEILDQGDNVH